MRSPSEGVLAAVVASSVLAAGTVSGRDWIEQWRWRGSLLYLSLTESGFERTVNAVVGRHEPTVDLTLRTPDQLLAGIGAPRTAPGFTSCLAGGPRFMPEVEDRLDELVRRRDKALPALSKALSSSEPLRVQVALTALRHIGLGAPAAIPRLDAMVSDAGLGDDAANVLWNSGEKGRARLEAAAFYPPEPPKLPKEGNRTPADAAAYAAFEKWSRREKAAQGPYYSDPDGGFEAYKRALASDQPRARGHAAYMLGLLEKRKAEGVAVIMQALESDTQWYARSSLIGALEKLGPAAHSALPLLRRLAADRETAHDALWALYAVAGDRESYGLILKDLAAGGRLYSSDLDTFVAGCAWSPEARAAMERAYVGDDYRDGNEGSLWRDALGRCLGNSLDKTKLAKLDSQHEKAAWARLEEYRKRRLEHPGPAAP